LKILQRVVPELISSSSSDPVAQLQAFSAGMQHTESGVREEHHTALRFARATSPRQQKIKELASRNLRIVLRFVLQTELHGLCSHRNETNNHFTLKGLAEREGFYTAVPKFPTRLAKSLLLKDRVLAHC